MVTSSSKRRRWGKDKLSRALRGESNVKKQGLLNIFDFARFGEAFFSAISPNLLSNSAYRQDICSDSVIYHMLLGYSKNSRGIFSHFLL